MKVEVDIPRHSGLAAYLAMHAPHLYGVLSAVAAGRLMTNLVVPDDEFFEYRADVPMLITISDDIGKSVGPYGFNALTLCGLIRQCRAATITTIWPMREIYDEAAAFALNNQVNVCIIETDQSNEGSWLKYIARANPEIRYAVYSDLHSGGAHA